MMETREQSPELLKTSKTKIEQKGIHAEYYYDKVSVEQSKYIALLVGISCGKGSLLLKNGDIVKIMLDLKSMFGDLVKNKKSYDQFIVSDRLYQPVDKSKEI